MEEALNYERHLDWKFQLLLFPLLSLEILTVLHVALIVFLRLNTIRNPLSRIDDIIKLRRYFIISIWIVSLVFSFLPTLASVFKLKEFYYYSKLFVWHSFGTVPVIGITGMYGLLIWTVRKNQGENKKRFPEVETVNAEENNRRMTLIISCLVTFLLICYIPHLVERQYYYGIMVNTVSEKLTFKVMLY